MNKMTKLMIGAITAAFVFASAKAQTISDVFPTDKPTVSFEGGYKSAFDVYGVQLAPASAYGKVSVVTPFKLVDFRVSALTAGSKFSAFEGDLAKSFNVGKNISFTVDAGADYYTTGTTTRNTVGVGLSLDKFPVLSYVAVPYVRYNYDIDGFNFGSPTATRFTNGGLTVGVKRPFTYKLNSWADVSLTPYVESTYFEGYQTLKGGGKLSFVLFKKLTPFAGVEYVDSNVNFGNFQYKGNVQYVAGLNLTF